MAARLPVYRTCKTPKPFGSPRGHRLEGPQRRCPAHEGTGAERQCAAELPRAGGPVRCRAWPLRELPHCGAHDPVQVKLRQEEAQSAKVRIARVLEVVAQASPLIRERVLDLLVAERQEALPGPAGLRSLR